MRPFQMICMLLFVLWNLAAQLTNHDSRFAFVNHLNVLGNTRFKNNFLAMRTFWAFVFFCEVIVEQSLRFKAIHAPPSFTFKLLDVMRLFDVAFQTIEGQKMHFAFFAPEFNYFCENETDIRMKIWIINLLKCAGLISSSRWFIYFIWFHNFTTAPGWIAGFSFVCCVITSNDRKEFISMIVCSNLVFSIPRIVYLLAFDRTASVLFAFGFLTVFACCWMLSRWTFTVTGISAAGTWGCAGESWNEITEVSSKWSANPVLVKKRHFKYPPSVWI